MQSREHSVVGLVARGKRGLTLSGHSISKSNRLPSKGSDPFYDAITEIEGWPSMITDVVSRALLAVLMIFAGIMHFVNLDFFLRIVPPYLPFHRALVYVSGVCEIGLGILLLIPQSRPHAAWGIIALLIAVFPANIYLYQNQHLVPAPPTFHFLRLVLQGVLIYWAFRHTR